MNTKNDDRILSHHLPVKARLAQAIRQAPRRPAPAGEDDGYRNRYREPAPEFDDPIPF